MDEAGRVVIASQCIHDTLLFSVRSTPEEDKLSALVIRVQTTTTFGAIGWWDLVDRYWLVWMTLQKTEVLIVPSPSGCLHISILAISDYILSVRKASTVLLIFSGLALMNKH